MSRNCASAELAEASARHWQEHFSHAMLIRVKVAALHAPAGRGADHRLVKCNSFLQVRAAGLSAAAAGPPADTPPPR